jgi:hypothetical protein
VGPPGHRDVVWAGVSFISLEHLRLTLGDDGSTADGLTVAVIGDRPRRLGYAVACDAAWLCRTVRVSLLDEPRRGLDLRADGRGGWATAAGQPLPGLDGCLDVDIMVTPYTNTLPIRRLRLPPGATADLRVAYVVVPSLEVRVDRQRYTCLARGATGGRFRYEGLETGFTADVEVDEDGLVVDYAGVFRRVWPKPPALD